MKVHVKGHYQKNPHHKKRHWVKGHTYHRGK